MYQLCINKTETKKRISAIIHVKYLGQCLACGKVSIMPVVAGAVAVAAARGGGGGGRGVVFWQDNSVRGERRHEEGPMEKFVRSTGQEYI